MFSTEQQGRRSTLFYFTKIRIIIKSTTPQAHHVASTTPQTLPSNSMGEFSSLIMLKVKVCSARSKDLALCVSYRCDKVIQHAACAVHEQAVMLENSE